MSTQKPLPPAGFYASLFLAREGIEQTLDVSIADPDTELAKSFRDVLINILDLNQKQRFLERDFQVARLKMFVKHLVEIQIQSPDLLADFSSMISEIGYYGLRFEIDVCASLLRKGVSFHHPDPPDFAIDHDDELLSIECSSSHVQTPTSNFERQIKSAIAAKSNKSYYCPETALFADITNLYYWGEMVGEPLEQDVIKSWVRERMNLIDNELEIGSVLLFFYFGSSETMGMSHHYHRIDSDDIDPALKSFLDSYYPIGSGTNPNPWIFSTP